MPLVLHESVSPSARMMLWYVSESIEYLEHLVALDDERRGIYQTFSHPSRKKQWLCYHHLVNLMFAPTPVLVRYTEFGKPYIDRWSGFISVTHSGDYVAVIVDEVNPVGVDLEQIRAKVERVKERFLSNPELETFGLDCPIEKLVVCWAAKEALYKTVGNPEVDFQHHIHLPHFDYLCSDIGTFQATISESGSLMLYDVFYRKVGGYMLVWTLKKEE